MADSEEVQVSSSTSPDFDPPQSIFDTDEILDLVKAGEGEESPKEEEEEEEEEGEDGDEPLLPDSTWTPSPVEPEDSGEAEPQVPPERDTLPSVSPNGPAQSSAAFAAFAASAKEEQPPADSQQLPSLADLLFWRDVKTTGVVFGATLLLLLSLTVCSIISVGSYVCLALLSVTICFRIYKTVLNSVQKSDAGHPFKQYLECEVALSEDLTHKYTDIFLDKINGIVGELRRLFLVEDLVDSVKFAVVMWILTYVGALFNGLTLLILAVIAAFTLPIIHEKHQAQINRYMDVIYGLFVEISAKIKANVPGLKPKAE
ncbi:reticulon-1-A-like isoform X3 [Stigmatopora argus]